LPATCPTIRSRPTNVAEPSLRYIIKYSTCPSPEISPVKVFATFFILLPLAVDPVTASADERRV
jgi:hypothetical protein